MDDIFEDLREITEQYEKEKEELIQEKRQEIVSGNIKRLYRLPKKYKYLNLVLDDVLRDYLLGILNYIKDKKTLYYNNKLYFFIDTNRLTYKIRKKTTKGSSNKYINYLCCIGLIGKKFQGREDFGYRDIIRMIEINKKFVKENSVKEPMNLYFIQELSEERLEIIEQRAEKLYKNGITKSNFSCNRLNAKNLYGMAREIFFQEHDGAIIKKRKEYSDLCHIIDSLIEKQGYATKKQIKPLLDISEKELEKVYSLFSDELKAKYTYKAPNKVDKDTFSLDGTCWIFKEREYI